MISEYFKTFGRSFYSPDAYDRALNRWQGMGAYYLFILAAIMALFTVFQAFYVLNSVDEQRMETFFASFPTITIQDGVASADVESPYDVALFSDDLTFRVDLRPPSDIAKDTTLRPKNALILYREKIEFITRGETQNIYQLERFDDLVLDKAAMKSGWKTVKRLPFYLYPILIIGIWAGYILHAIGVSLISFLLTAMHDREYEFHDRMRMSAVALTPPIILNTISTYSVNHIIHPIFIAAIASLYLYLMLRVISEDARTAK